MSIREAMQSGTARSSDSTPGVAPGLGRGFQRRGWLPRPASVGSLLYEWQQSGHGSRAGALEWPDVLQRGLPILAFFLGNLLGFLVLTQVRHWGMRSPFAVVFGLEAV